MAKRKIRQEAGSNTAPACCKQCGTCCRKGGPALHGEDKKMLSEGHIALDQLVTLRKGEFAFSPLSGRLEPIEAELVKIAGKGNRWCCSLYDEAGSHCTMYAHRPLECRLLKCWDTREIMFAIGKDTLTRADILGSDDPILNQIEIHERECSPLVFEHLISALEKNTHASKSRRRLAELVQHDLALRSKAVSAFGLSLGVELFLFGRPLFKTLSWRGLSVTGHISG